MDKNELAIQKARNLRYKKPVARDLNLEAINQWLWDSVDLISDVQYYIHDEFNLLNALDGDDEEAEEFKLAFSQLAGEVEQFQDDLQGEWVSEYFDIFFPAVGAGDAFGGYLGYDEYENDYFGLEPFEYAWGESEAARQIMRLTKKDMLFAAGSCLKIATQYLAVRYRYDCLEASLKIIQGQNLEVLRVVKAIDEKYGEAEKASEGFTLRLCREVHEYDKLLAQIPQEFWVQ